MRDCGLSSLSFPSPKSALRGYDIQTTSRIKLQGRGRTWDKEMDKSKIELVNREDKSDSDDDGQRFLILDTDTDTDTRSGVHQRQTNRKGQRGNNPSPTTEDEISTGCSDEEDKAGHVVEYEWPVNSGVHHFIEQYLAEFLQIKSLRRSFPDLVRRRIMCIEEREFLLDNDLVSNLQADLGIVAIFAEDVYKLIAPKYPKEFQAYTELIASKTYEKTVQAIWDKTLDEPSIVSQLRKATAEDCAKWNLNRYKSTRKYKSRRYRDSQTKVVHKPIENVKTENCFHTPTPTAGCFPVALIPGQYVDNPLRFTSEYLQRLPVNTVLQLQLENELDVSSIASSKICESFNNESPIKSCLSIEMPPSSCCTSRTESCEEDFSSSSETFFENIFRVVLSSSSRKKYSRKPTKKMKS